MQRDLTGLEDLSGLGSPTLPSSTPRPDGDDLSQNAQRHLGRLTTPEIEPNRPVEARQLGFADAGLEETKAPELLRPLAPQGADIEGRAAESDQQGGIIQLRVVGEHGHGGARRQPD
jgi:hypothetical protein